MALKSEQLKILKVEKEQAQPILRTIEAIYLAQPVQYAGTLRTFFRADEGFEMTKVEGNIIVFSPTKGYSRELEIGFSNISAVLWKYEKSSQ